MEEGELSMVNDRGVTCPAFAISAQDVSKKDKGVQNTKPLEPSKPASSHLVHFSSKLDPDPSTKKNEIA